MIYGETLWKANNPFDIKGGGLGIALVNVNVFSIDHEVIKPELVVKLFLPLARKPGRSNEKNPSEKPPLLKSG